MPKTELHPENLKFRGKYKIVVQPNPEAPQFIHVVRFQNLVSIPDEDGILRLAIRVCCIDNQMATFSWRRIVSIEEVL